MFSENCSYSLNLVFLVFSVFFETKKKKEINVFFVFFRTQNNLVHVYKKNFAYCLPFCYIIVNVLTTNASCLPFCCIIVNVIKTLTII